MFFTSEDSQKEQASKLSVEEIIFLQYDLEKTKGENELLKSRLSYYELQLYGSKSEKGLNLSDGFVAVQEKLGEWVVERTPELVEEKTIAEHKRKVTNYKKEFPGTPEDSGLRFDINKAVVKDIRVPAEGIENLREDEYEVISTKISYRVGKQVSYYVNRYLQDVVKLKGTGKIISSPLPRTVFAGSFLETGLVAGILVDKFKYHLPLYRQNQMLADAGICLSRSMIVSTVLKSANLLEPLSKEVIKSIKEGRILSMDEVPILVGPSKSGGGKNCKMKKGYVWPIYGDRGEVGFVYNSSRAAYHIEDMLGLKFDSEKILLSDGHSSYHAYKKKVGEIKQAFCWAHVRRKFVEALEFEKEACSGAIELIGRLYGVEKRMRESKIVDPEKILNIRKEESKPVAEEFFNYLDKKLSERAFLPSNLFTKACNYAFKLQEGLLLYLSEPDLPIDNNHTERAIRPIVLGRKNWLFCWTEVGAEAVAIIQTLISSCVLQGISPHAYLKDILINIDNITNKNVREYIPREWKKSQNTESSSSSTLPIS